jgi:4-alpha-glucanotransferase
MSGALHALARAAGIQTHWRDVGGVMQSVSDASITAVLSAIGYPAANSRQISESHELLEEESRHRARPLITAEVNRPIPMPGSPAAFQIRLESGGVIEGRARVLLPGIAEPGYHRLDSGDRQTIIAVAPPHAYTLADAGQGAKLWGLAVQIYALRRAGDGGIGDFGALAEFCGAAAARGADAVAISPVHAQFSAEVTNFSPYAPSDRTVLNALLIAEPEGEDVAGDLIDWPVAGAGKLARLRKAFAEAPESEAFGAFRAQAGQGVERHAIFEALHEHFAPALPDWRKWPPAYRNPESDTVKQFAREHRTKIDFHAWLQYRADADLGRAQRAARDAGMKIGLITDLAVGTDHAGSASWCRPDEVLRGLELGAPPDAINREGQSWGITAFSPRGLRNSGFSGFIAMLRAALRHAGGVRIDHIMGLARLWVIPEGRQSAEGAYLTMPVEDLLRLLVLESHRHQAVILGEDLGTLPDGFQSRLDQAGIAGLRVMWFERQGQKFAPPASWTKTAVGMTSTHDLPTVAGWWEGTDIAWRDRLGMAGDSAADRAADRFALWSAFQASGAASPPQPGPRDGAAAADAACTHLGGAACQLALLPLEDALAAVEQPNLPGTVDEHPNWRRRYPGPAAEILGRPDVVARLTALDKSRSGH